MDTDFSGYAQRTVVFCWFCGFYRNTTGCFFVCQGSASGVRVNSIAPGVVETSLVGEVPHDQLVGMTGATQLIGRPIQPEEVRLNPRDAHSDSIFAVLLLDSFFTISRQGPTRAATAATIIIQAV